MLSRVDASELAQQLHHYLDSLNDEAVRDFAVVFGSRLPAETRSLLFTTLEKPAASDLRETVRSAEAQQLKFAMSSVLWFDQCAAEAIPELVQQSLRTYRAFILSDEFADVRPHRRRFISYAGIAIVAVLTLVVAFLDPVQRAQIELRMPHWLQHSRPPVARTAVHRPVPVRHMRIAVERPEAAAARGGTHAAPRLAARKPMHRAPMIPAHPQPVAHAVNDPQTDAARTIAPPVQDQLSMARGDAKAAIDAASAYVTDTNPGVTIQSARVVEQSTDGAVVEVLSDDDGASVTDRITLSVNAAGYTVRAQQRAGSASPATSRACFDGRQWKECSGGG